MTSTIFDQTATVAMLWVALSVSGYAQTPPADDIPEIVTDRPDVTESSIVVPTGRAIL